MKLSLVVLSTALILSSFHTTNVCADEYPPAKPYATYVYYLVAEMKNVPNLAEIPLETDVLEKCAQPFRDANPLYSFVKAGENYTTVAGLKYCPQGCTPSTADTSCTNLGCAVCMDCSSRRARRMMRSLQEGTSPVLGKDKADVEEKLMNAELSPLCSGVTGCSIESAILVDHFNGTASRVSQDVLWATTGVYGNGDGARGRYHGTYKQGKLAVYSTHDEVNTHAPMDYYTEPTEPTVTEPTAPPTIM